ncbi:MAG: SAM-dependent methyltransferase [Bacteroidales bacterium]|nr:SAM-dependent methyltransferase [Bacteroidales bacterium]
MEGKTLQFIIDHEGEDVTRFILSPAKYPGVEIPLAARCIEARKKIKGKIPAFYAEPSLLYPDTLALEQCSSQASAEYKSRLIPKGATVADLTGGLGVDSYFLSRRASKLTYYERKPHLAEAAQENFRTLGAMNIDCHTAELTLEEIQSPDFPSYDTIYLDPARRDKMGGRVYSIADCEPNLALWRTPLLAKANTILAKVSPMADISQILGEVPGIGEIHILSVDHECKELLLKITGTPVDEPHIYCINLLKNGEQHFEFSRSEEGQATATYFPEDGLEDIAQGQCYLYEPNKSISKGGAFKLLSQRYGVMKVSPATHLYLSSEAVEGFPGKCYRVLEGALFNKRILGEWKKKYPKGSVSAKNFPLTSEELAKRLSVKEDDRMHIFGFTSLAGTKYLFATERVF